MVLVVFACDTVDGSELLRSPVEVGSLSHYLQGFIYPRWLFGTSSINSISSLDHMADHMPYVNGNIQVAKLLTVNLLKHPFYGVILVFQNGWLHICLIPRSQGKERKYDEIRKNAI